MYGEGVTEPFGSADGSALVTIFAHSGREVVSAVLAVVNEPSGGLCGAGDTVHPLHGAGDWCLRNVGDDRRTLALRTSWLTISVPTGAATGVSGGKFDEPPSAVGQWFGV